MFYFFYTTTTYQPITGFIGGYKQSFAHKLFVFFPIVLLRRKKMPLVISRGMKTFTPSCTVVFPSFLRTHITTLPISIRQQHSCMQFDE